MSEYIVDMYCESSGVKCEPVVRCKSCKYYDERETSGVYSNHHWCDELANYMPPNGFCSFGERRGK